MNAIRNAPVAKLASTEQLRDHLNCGCRYFIQHFYTNFTLKKTILSLFVFYQLFRTEKLGWGIRCLDDIPKGEFICVYAGHLLTEQEANEDGKKNGDEYLAELDLIESIEQAKDGYESDVDIDADQPGNSDSSRGSSDGSNA